MFIYYADDNILSAVGSTSTQSLTHQSPHFAFDALQLWWKKYADLLLK